MDRSKSIEALIIKSRKDFEELKYEYQRSLDKKTILEELKIDIKNIFENLRSCLDYLAHDINEGCINIKPKPKLYFPVRQTKKEFDNTIATDFPDLQKIKPEIYNILESIQPYCDNWLGNFNRLNNNNKHQDLQEQTRTESRFVNVTSKKLGGSVSWGPGVTFGNGVSVMGVPIDPRTQMPIPNKQVNTLVTIWINFLFTENNESVLPFIEKSINKIDDICKEVKKYI